MSLMRSGAVACLLLVFANAGSNAADETPAQDLILGKWSMEPRVLVVRKTRITGRRRGRCEKKIVEEKIVTEFTELEFRNDGKAKLTFWLGAPETLQGTRELTYRLSDKSTLKFNSVPRSKKDKAERYEIVLLTEDRLTLRFKRKGEPLRFHRIK